MSDQVEWRYYHRNERSAQATLKHVRNVIDKHYKGDSRQQLINEITALQKEDDERKLFYARPLGELFDTSTKKPYVPALDVPGPNPVYKKQNIAGSYPEPTAKNFLSGQSAPTKAIHLLMRTYDMLSSLTLGSNYTYVDKLNQLKAEIADYLIRGR